MYTLYNSQAALAHGRAAWATGDAVTPAQANAALIRAVEELDAAAASSDGALRHDAVAPAFTERLGAGAYGTTYRGCLHGTPAVLKEYRVVRGDTPFCDRPVYTSLQDADGTTIAGMWQRFTHNREVLALSVLEAAGRQHTFVRPLIDHAARGTGLIMPLFPMGTLGHWLTTANLSVPALLHCCYTAAADLEAVHAAGVAHLDIRPDNIGLRMAAEEGHPTAQLIDWGLAVVGVVAACPAVAVRVEMLVSVRSPGVEQA